MLKCSASLWSADLANLAAEIKRIESYVDRFHFDVADGQYVETLLFFPDLVNLFTASLHNCASSSYNAGWQQRLKRMAGSAMSPCH